MLTFPAKTYVAMVEFLVRLLVVLLIFSLGMVRFLGVFWSILCRTSKEMIWVVKMYQSLIHTNY